ncbi:MAG TPA: hypothetical protein VHJ17_22650 [Thermomonospora sp.]|nr:hypothetical protein [Thermomonospora sp.]
MGYRRPEASRERRHDHPPRPGKVRLLLRRPAVWLGSVLAAGVLATVTATAGVLGGRLGTGLGTSPGEGRDPVGHHVIVDHQSPDAYALPRALTEGPDRTALLTGRAEAASLAARHQGAAVSSLAVTLVLTGQRTAPVTVVDVHPELAAPCTSNLNGTYIPVLNQGDRGAASFTVDMDKPKPRLVRTDRKGQTFPQLNIDLKLDERYTLALVFTARRHHCAFTLKVRYLDRKGPATLTVTDPEGRPFALTGKARRYAVRY